MLSRKYFECCNKCTERSATCHSTCEKYLTDVKERNKELKDWHKKLNEDMDITIVTVDAVTKRMISKIHKTKR